MPRSFCSPYCEVEDAPNDRLQRVAERSKWFRLKITKRFKTVRPIHWKERTESKEWFIYNRTSIRQFSFRQKCHICHMLLTSELKRTSFTSRIFILFRLYLCFSDLHSFSFNLSCHMLVKVMLAAQKWTMRRSNPTLHTLKETSTRHTNYGS